jgi:Tol biopolymer transport system component
MALANGTKLGPYEIQSAAGAGGMGEVYRARDTRLDRTVAIKILPAYLSQMPDAKQRFEREARAISSLQHPNICTLFDIGNDGGTDYLVMEYLEGETLADRLRKGPLPPEQVLKYGIEIAEGLEKAHRSGVVHRDLKPANIMLTKSGAKLMDFGLAKTTAAAPPASGLTATLASPHASHPLTAEGMVVGTFQYMSPEVVEGQEADARSDIFSLGAVLYEMATGRRAFAGKSQASVAAAILASDPQPISSVQPMSPPALDRVVKGCLAKDPEERWQTAHDVKLQLEWIAEGGSQAGIPAPVSARRKLSQHVAWAAAAVCLLAAIAFGVAWLSRTPTPQRTLRVNILAPENVTFHPFDIALSPDGSKLAFVATDSSTKTLLWVRPLDSISAQPLAGTDGAGFPFWSPDSRNIGFFADGKLKRVQASGGGLQVLADASLGRGGTWNSEGVIVFAPSGRGGLYRVSATGGTPVQVTDLDPKVNEASHRWPWFLPDGRHFLYLGWNGSDSPVAGNAPQSGKRQAAIYAGSLDSKERVLVTDSSIRRPMYVRPGYMLFMRGFNLMAQRFDDKHLRLIGDPTPVGEHVAMDFFFNAAYAASDNGTLILHSGGIAANSIVSWYGGDGKATAVFGRDNFNAIRFSPDDRTLSASIFDNTGGEDIWLFDLARGVKTRFTFGPNLNDDPVWSPDGSQIAFDSNRTGTYALYEKPSNGAQKEVLLFSDPAVKFTTSWSPDGQYVLFDREDPAQKTKTDIWVLPMSGDHKAFPLINAEFDERYGVFSPDGKWVAYVSNESGKNEVYVVAFPHPAARFQISTNGGADPQWRGDGKEIFYVDPDHKIMGVDLTSRGDSLQLGTPNSLFQARLQNLDPPYAATADGKRFLVNELPPNSASDLEVVFNWDAELKK